MLQIIPYLPGHQIHFESLNKAWIEKFFVLEPVDREVLEHPDVHITGNGGRILMALWDGEVAGTVALKYTKEGRLEMTKMAVDGPYQGKKIGEALVRACIAEARDMGARRLILYSSTVLGNAIHLYRKVGFTETLPREDSYLRSDIKMEMPLRPFDREEREQLLYDYARGYDDITDALRGIPENMWDWRESADRWNIHEIIQHLCDSEANAYFRCRRILAEPGSVIPAYDEARWARTLYRAPYRTAEALELYRGLRTATAHLLRQIPDDAWQNEALHAERGPMTLQDWLWTYTHHTHIGQMKRLYRHYTQAHPA